MAAKRDGYNNPPSFPRPSPPPAPPPASGTLVRVECGGCAPPVYVKKLPAPSNRSEARSAPMTPALEQIKALPAKWRELVREVLGQGPSGHAHLKCADDLDTALQALAQENAVRDKEPATIEAGDAAVVQVRGRAKRATGEWGDWGRWSDASPEHIQCLTDTGRIAAGFYEVRHLYTRPTPAAPVSDEAGKARIVAWTRTEAIRDANGYPIGTDETEVRWGSEHPDPDELWFPLYDGPAPAAEAAPQDGVSVCGGDGCPGCDACWDVGAVIETEEPAATRPAPAAEAAPQGGDVCFCDAKGLGVPGVSCGDCPRDYAATPPSAPADGER